MVTRTWETRELPILEAVAGFEERTARPYWSEYIGKALGFDNHTTQLAFQALYEAKYLTASVRYGPGVYSNPRLLERGRRAVGQWPTDDPYVDLVALLDVRLEATTDATERGRLELLRDALVGVGRDVGTSLLTAWLKATLSLP